MFTVFFGSLIGIIAIVAGAVLYNYALEESRKRTRQKLLARLDNAEALVQNGMLDDALKIYGEVSRSATGSGRGMLFPDIYALCRYGEGQCFRKKAGGAPEFSSSAIQSYEEFLRHLPSAGIGIGEELKRGETYYHLGLLYLACITKLQVRDRTAYLKRAESLLASALTFVDLFAQEAGAPPGDAARVRASIHQALGDIHFELAETEHRRGAEQSLMKAIEAYDEASRIYTPGPYPVEHAAIVKAKALSFKKLFSLSDDIQFMKCAVDMSKELVAHREAAGSADEHFASLQELADYSTSMALYLADADDNEQNRTLRQELLKDATACYERILQLSHEDKVLIFSNDRAAVYQKLGSVKMRLFELEPAEALLEEGITLNRKALEYVSEGSVEFATIQAAIGDLYLQLSRRRSRKDDVAKAKAAYAAAIKIFDVMGLTSYKQTVELSLKSIDCW
ncbi:MAG: hypothetical protein AB1805_16860 [Nitrospirota bacterium]